MKKLFTHKQYNLYYLYKRNGKMHFEFRDKTAGEIIPFTINLMSFMLDMDSRYHYTNKDNINIALKGVDLDVIPEKFTIMFNGLAKCHRNGTLVTTNFVFGDSDEEEIYNPQQSMKVMFKYPSIYEIIKDEKLLTKIAAYYSVEIGESTDFLNWLKVFNYDLPLDLIYEGFFFGTNDPQIKICKV